MESTKTFTCPNYLRNAQSVELKQKRKEVPDGECAQKGTATPAVFTSPQQLSGNQSNPLTFSAYFLKKKSASYCKI
jgi:hypothetical protein